MASSSDRRDQDYMGWCWLCPGSQEACLEAVSVVSSPGGGLQLLQDEGALASEKI